jgi:exonuclease SbcD
MTVSILHFADAHIDMANYGRHDAQNGLPVRVVDFLKSLDTIIEAAISQKVDLVLFAGDAYKDRNPTPTFQREWGKRVMRLSRAGIPTVLLVGNHDLSPALGRAHALDSFYTLEVPHVQVVDKPKILRPSDLGGVPLQIIALPWISRSGLVAHLGLGQAGEPAQVYEQLENRLIEVVHHWLESEIDPALPVVLAAHCSIEGAVYGSERTVMLGGDLTLPRSLVRDPRLDYVALGHIHKRQDLNDGAHPPAVYPGSIERVDFGEVQDEKYYLIAHVSRGNTRLEWRKLDGIRPFFDRFVRLDSQEGIMERLRAELPPPTQLKGAVVRLVLEYPRDMERAIDEAALREHTAECLEFHLIKRPLSEARIRLPGDPAIGALSPVQLLERYWLANHLEPSESEELKKLAVEIIHSLQDETN